MNTTNLHTASFDDIVFEGRNKAYGAFVLRQLYNRHLARALAITVALCLLLVSLPLVLERIWPTVLPAAKAPEMTPTTLIEVVLPPQSKAVTPPPAARQQPVVVTPRPADIPTQVVKDDKLIKPQPTTEPADANSTMPTDATAGPGTIIGVATGPTGPVTDSGTAAPAVPAKPFTYAEVMPEFTGGMKALQKYMQRNMRFPREAAAAAISGKVFVSFTVQTDGSISDVQVMKGLGYGTDEEAARVVKNMPPWTPGRQNSRAVAVRYTLPITFQYE
ncbi:energy transducer TonB [Hymenobacter lucidus]|uniref:TonB family protein n=1 Tax=Hymenobacter lucidus TaxID=2880930 RepID=A0ABS8AU06_9BACT|nr:energy transducer TonB [Hymenobacter lucidus]MCB2409468.1 TonB family protein [Hymenobacter lucidus]